MAKKVNPPVEPTNKVMSGYAKKAYASLVKKHGPDHMSKLAKKRWAKKRAEDKKKEAALADRRERDRARRAAKK